MSVDIAKNVGPSGINMAYERFGDLSATPVFLIMGGGAQMITWPDEFCRQLANHGLQVIRFDNRDAGLSTHFNNAPVPDFAATMRGDFSTVSYSLSDMAADTIGLIRALGFDSVHLVGASMGGMIAQTVAIEYPQRVKSLTSMMSTTGASGVGQTDFATLSSVGTPPDPNNREEYIEWQIKGVKAVGSPVYPFDEEGARERFNIAWERDHDPLGMLRQAVSVIKTGDRTERLRKLKVPTLVIHGKADKMIHVSGGIATAEAIPGARLELFEGMGHGFPRELWSHFTDLIADHVNNAATKTAE
ncbi:MAG TPA: alpha/beta hydrolase [Bacteroidales bacterium]|nr:alpha/beta hydrolase [Bacteroidales bacterium]